MKRFFCGLALFVALAACLPAQEHAPIVPNDAAEKKEGHDEMLGWKWANFALLALGLGYLGFRNLPAFFNARTVEIQQGIREASKMNAEAKAKVAEIERQLAGVGDQIDKLRSQLKSDMEAEGVRIQQSTERNLKRIQEQAEQEVAFMTKAARSELKTFSASLALDLAKQRIQSRINPETQHWLVESFVHDLQTAPKEGQV